MIILPGVKRGTDNHELLIEVSFDRAYLLRFSLDSLGLTLLSALPTRLLTRSV